MKRFLGTVVAAGLLVGLIAAPVSAAPGGITRNQVTTNVYHLIIGGNHTFTIQLGCGGVLSATGYQDVNNPVEDITATLSSDMSYINISSVYVGGWGGSPYSWVGGFPVAGGTGTAATSDGGNYSFDVVLLSTGVSAYANHGAYVTAMGGGDDAAHSCIGMPIVAG